MVIWVGLRIISMQVFRYGFDVALMQLHQGYVCVLYLTYMSKKTVA